MHKQGDQVACIIVEPVAGNMGMVPPVDGFLQTLRHLTEKSGTLLIFDEVMTGFRVALGGAQSLYGVAPDLTCFGKVIGGGLPVGAYGGRSDVMAQVAPQGSVYQAGTLSGNPIAMAAGIATLQQVMQEGFYDQLAKTTRKLADGLSAVAQQAGIAVRVGHVGSMLGMFFADQEIKNFDDAKKCDLELFSAFYNGMRENGIYIAPSQFEALFVSAAHSAADIDETIQAAKDVLKDLSS